MDETYKELFEHIRFRCAGAITVYTRGIYLNSIDATAYINRGKVREDRKHSEEAQEACMIKW